MRLLQQHIKLIHKLNVLYVLRLWSTFMYKLLQSSNVHLM